MWLSSSEKPASCGLSRLRTPSRRPLALIRGHGQFGEHLQTGIERIINLRPGFMPGDLGMSNGSRVRATCAMMLFPFKWQFFHHGRVAGIRPPTARVIKNSPLLSNKRKMPYWALVTSSASCKIDSSVSSRRRRDEISKPRVAADLILLLCVQDRVECQPDGGHDKLPWRLD